MSGLQPPAADKYLRREMDVAAREFYRRLVDGQLATTRCDRCERVTFPPRAGCLSLRRAAELGRVPAQRAAARTFTTQESALRFAAPAVLALAELGGVVVPGIAQAPYETLRIGQEVRVELRPEPETGLTLLAFVPQRAAQPAGWRAVAGLRPRAAATAATASPRGPPGSVAALAPKSASQAGVEEHNAFGLAGGLQHGDVGADEDVLEDEHVLEPRPRRHRHVIRGGGRCRGAAVACEQGSHGCPVRTGSPNKDTPFTQEILSKAEETYRPRQMRRRAGRRATDFRREAKSGGRRRGGTAS